MPNILLSTENANLKKIMNFTRTKNCKWRKKQGECSRCRSGKETQDIRKYTIRKKYQHTISDEKEVKGMNTEEMNGCCQGTFKKCK